MRYRGSIIKEYKEPGIHREENKKMKSQRKHVCDTDSPQRPCCWAARAAELAAMKAREASGETAKAQAEHDAKIEAEGGFITRGLD